MGTIWTPDLSGASGPKYLRLLRALREAVDRGTLSPGARLPPVRDLAYALGITPGTVARAYRTAVEEGLLSSVVGRGTYVTGGATPATPDEPPLIEEVGDGLVDCRACLVPDVGQGAELADLFAEIGAAGGAGLMGYPDASCDLELAARAIDWLGPAHLGPAVPEDMALGLGAQHASILVLQTLLAGAHPVILTEDLAYPGIRHAARMLRAQLVGVEMDEDGIRPEALDEACRRTGAQVLVTAAEVHSPTTVRTSAARKRDLVAVARRHQLHVVEDDCHRIARTDVPAYRQLYPERGWYITSLSKCLSPSLRIGFAVAPKGQGAALRRVAHSTFYGMPAPLVQVGRRSFDSGLVERSRTGVLGVVGRRARAAAEILGGYDIRWRADAPFLWLYLPAGWRASRFAVASEVAGIRTKPADEFAMLDASAPHAVRIALTPRISEPAFAETMHRLEAILARPPQDMDG